MPFDEAWRAALSLLPLPSSSHDRLYADRRTTLDALEATVEDWRLAYERRPARELARSVGSAVAA